MLTRKTSYDIWVVADLTSTFDTKFLWNLDSFNIHYIIYKRSWHFSSLNDLAPTSGPSKKSHYGIPWMGWKCPEGINYLVSSPKKNPSKFFLLLTFSSQLIFFLLSFPSIFLFSLHSWPKFFFGTSYLPTYHPSFYQPIHLPHNTDPSSPTNFALTSIISNFSIWV
jgi:hypothetical protein